MSDAEAARSESANEHDAPYEQLAVVERYERFVDYLYPILMGVRRAHYIVRDRAIGAMLDQVSLFQEAGKSNQVSKLYAADAGLATLRFLLRFMASPSRKLISARQHQVASVLLAESGKMLGAWIRRVRTAKR
jgi:hypothetical protein